MPRPIILGVVGDSAAGKTTMTRGLVRALGEHVKRGMPVVFLDAPTDSSSRQQVKSGGKRASN